MHPAAHVRILIVRLSAIGDCILTTPLACALRGRFPRAHIAWAVEPSSSALIDRHPALDEVIVVSKGWLKSPSTAWALRKRLRAKEFDIAIDPQSLTKSALLARLSGAKRRIGFAGDHGRELSPWLNNVRVAPFRSHIVDRSLELLRPLGIEQPEVRFDLPVYAEAAESVKRFLEASRLTSRFALVNPGAGWPSKVWPAERYGAVVRRLGDRCGTRSLVVWAGEEEQGWAEQIVGESGGHAVLANLTSLTELAEFARRAVLFVGSDTGPLHLAAAVGTPCVAMYGPTRPEDCGPYGPLHFSLQEQRLEGGNRERRTADNDAMKAIGVEAVVKACTEVLARPSASAA